MDQEQVWDKIAESWAENRQDRGYPEVYEFLRNKKGRILDVGCGHCRYLSEAKAELYGIDFSANMIKEAEKYCKEHDMKVILKKANVDKLPFPDNFFDAIICIAVLHLIKDGKIEKPLTEIKRVLKPGVPALISVWYKNNKGEKLKPWPTKKENVLRYYYFFDEKDLEEKIKQAGLEITRSYTTGFKDRKNLFFEVRKPL